MRTHVRGLQQLVISLTRCRGCRAGTWRLDASSTSSSQCNQGHPLKILSITTNQRGGKITGLQQAGILVRPPGHPSKTCATTQGLKATYQVPRPKEREQAHWRSQPSVCSNPCRASSAYRFMLSSTCRGLQLSWTKVDSAQTHLR